MKKIQKQHIFFIFFCDSGGEWDEIIIFRELCKQKQCNALTDPHTQGEAKPSQVILHNTHSAGLESCSTQVHRWPILSLSDQSPTPEPRVGGVCSCWRTHPTGRQPAVSALQRRPRSVLWPAASPQWVCVSECVCMQWRGEGVIAGRPQSGVEFKLTCLRATFSCKNAPVLLACDSKERPIPHLFETLQIYCIFNEIQVSGSSTKGSDRLEEWSKSSKTAVRKSD